MKQTAVEWLIEQLKVNNYISDNAHWLIQEAKEMEKEQITDAYLEGGRKGFNFFGDDFEQYYKETYYKETFKL